MTTVLLTGANGFLGSHLLEALLDNDYQVVILKRSTSDLWRINHLLSKVICYDIDREPFLTAFQEQAIDIVVHLATFYRKIDSANGVNDMVGANFTFPVELIEAATRNGVKAFINTGTYFEVDCSHAPVSEEADAKPFNLYAKLKTSFDEILKTYSDQMAIVTLRLFSPYGEKDNPKLIPLIIKKAIQEETLELSEGFQKMDFIYAKDIVSAYLLAINDLMAKDKPFGYQLYNLGSGKAYSVRDVVSIVEQSMGIRINVTWQSPSIVDIPFVVSDISKIKRSLGWESQYSFNQGIENTIQYYRGVINNDI